MALTFFSSFFLNKSQKYVFGFCTLKSMFLLENVSILKNKKNYKKFSVLSTKVLLVGNEIGTTTDSRRHWCFVPFLQIFAGIGQDKLEDKLAHRSVGPLRCPQLA